jgi:hypothetical protein
MERDAVEQLLQLALGELTPSAADKARHRAALGLATSTGAAAPAKTTRGWTALRASGGAGWTAGAVLLGAGMGLGFWLRQAVAPAQQDAAAPPPTAALASASSPSTAPALPDSAPSSGPELLEGGVADAVPTLAHASAARALPGPKPERRATSKAATSSSEPFVAQPFDEELALLQRVERALRANNPSLAMVLIGELDERFAETRLGEERDAARRIAECRLQLPGWRQRAERFLSERPGSVYAQRVRAACGSE